MNILKFILILFKIIKFMNWFKIKFLILYKNVLKNFYLLTDY